MLKKSLTFLNMFHNFHGIDIKYYYLINNKRVDYLCLDTRQFYSTAFFCFREKNNQYHILCSFLLMKNNLYIPFHKPKDLLLLYYNLFYRELEINNNLLVDNKFLLSRREHQTPAL